MLGNIRFSNQVTNITNASRAFECHPGGEEHGKLLLSLATAGVAANLSLAGLIVARTALRRWSSGLLVHGTVVDGCRAALLLPLSLSVLKCQPVLRCSLIDTTFLLLATVSSLNLLTASLSDAPLLPPPVLVPSLLKSAGFVRAKTRQKQFTSPLYPSKASSSYYSDYYDEDANLLAETTAMPDSPQCVLFGSFMVWFAALVINLGPTFLSGAIAAQAEIIPTVPSCPLVRGPARHLVLNVLWASVNLLCVCLAASHLRKLKRDLGNARIGLLAAAGAGLAGMAGITNFTNTPASANSTTNYSNPNYVNKPGSALSLSKAQQNANVSTAPPPAGGQGQGGGKDTSFASRSFTAGELDVFLRQAQKTGQCHIRTLGSLAILNLICWVPLYTCALLAPVGTAIWHDPISPFVYEVALMLTFAHCVLHPIFLLFLHQPLRDEFRHCLVDTFCCCCMWFGMECGDVNNDDEGPPSPPHERDYEGQRGIGGGGGIGGEALHSSFTAIHNNPGLSREVDYRHLLNSRASSQNQLRSSSTQNVLLNSVGSSKSIDNIAHKLRRTPSVKSIKSNRSLGLTGAGSGFHIASLAALGGTELLIGRSMHDLSPMHCSDEEEIIELGLPPAPLPPRNAAFRKQASMEDRSTSLMENRW